MKNFSQWTDSDVEAFNRKASKASEEVQGVESYATYGTPLESFVKESELHNKIIAECRQRGWIYFHGSMAHRAMRTIGEPDFTILADKGRVFFCECKNSVGKLSPQQLALKVWAEKLGHTIHTVRSFQEFLSLI